MDSAADLTGSDLKIRNLWSRSIDVDARNKISADLNWRHMEEPRGLDPGCCRNLGGARMMAEGDILC